MEWVLHVVNEGVLPVMAIYQVHNLSQDPVWRFLPQQLCLHEQQIFFGRYAVSSPVWC